MSGRGLHLLVWAALLVLSVVMDSKGQTQSTGSTTFRGAATVKVIRLSPPDPASMVRITRIELEDDNMKLEIENTAPEPVIAVDIRYALSGCLVEGPWGVGSGADTRREPGMTSIDIPARSRVWYEDQHMASHLAYTAITQKTRYLWSRPEVIAAVFASGTKARWESLGDIKHSVQAVESAVCEKWRWNDELNSVRGFRPPVRNPDTGSRQTYGRATGVTFTCSVTDNLLKCPE
jgi:hypothetical protein